MSEGRSEEQHASIFGTANGHCNGKKPAEATGRVPDTVMERLSNLLEEAGTVAKGLDTYLVANTSPVSDGCAALNKLVADTPWGELHAAGKTLFRFSSNWTTDAVEGQLLATLCAMSKAKRVLEVGMFVGFAALSMAEALPEDGVVVTCEIDPFLKELTAPVFAAAPHGRKIDVRVGPATDTLDRAIAAGEEYDLVFVDADKGNYRKYYDAALRLLAPGGVVVVDNTLFKGQAYAGSARVDPFCWNAGGEALRDFNAYALADPRTVQVMLPVRDGITIFRKQSAAPAVETPPPTARVDDVATPVKDVIARLRLDGKTALVTGGGQGIGRALAHALAEAGARVCIADINAKTAEAVAEEIRAVKRVDSFAVRADVTKAEDCEAMVLSCVDRWGTLDIAVNNSGINKNAAAEDTTLEDWDATFAVNTRGLFACCQAEVKSMIPKRYGKIINIASMATLLVPHPQKQIAYNASKAAVVKLSETLACEMIGRGINVNCISPGIVNTALIQNSAELKPLVSTWLDQIPAGRLAEVTDLQAAVVYLASDASSYMVGHNLAICGGQELW